jgi:hypothetical protein
VTNTPRSLAGRLRELEHDATRPRIVIDDSQKILHCNTRSSGDAMSTLISQMPLVRPISLAVGSDGTLFVGDAGSDSTWSGPQVRRGLWHLPLRTSSGPPVTTPRLIPSDSWMTAAPSAMTVDDGRPSSLYVLLANGRLHRLSGPEHQREALGTLPVRSPRAMVYDSRITGGGLVVLDAGAKRIAPPSLLLCRGVKTGTMTVTRLVLTQAIEVLSLAILSSGDLLLGDCNTKGDRKPGNLRVIDRSDGVEDPTKWKELPRLLLPNDRDDNPLAAPVAMRVENRTHVLVLDAGLKPFLFHDTPFSREVAQQGALYRVEIDPSRPSRASIERVSARGGLVAPTAMVVESGTAYVADPGVTHQSGFRVSPDEFGVVVHFGAGPAGPDDKRKLLRAVSKIAQEEKPASALATIVSQA